MCFCRSLASIVLTLANALHYAIRLVLTVFAQEYEQQHRDGAPGRTLPGLLSPSGSAHGLIIVVTGPVFHPTTWLPE